jgi:hypothetical protein
MSRKSVLGLGTFGIVKEIVFVLSKIKLDKIRG